MKLSPTYAEALPVQTTLRIAEAIVIRTTASN